MSRKKIVIKLGTSSLTRGTKKLSRRHILDFVRQIAELRENGDSIVLVSSGAIAAGKEILTDTKGERSLPLRKMFAAVGQRLLMQMWAEMFSLYDITVGQVLLVRDDFSSRTRYLNIRDTLNSLLAHRILPIINENDAVTTDEIKVGDNDNLSALVANQISADLLILLTDQKGLYTADPRIDPQAQLISVVDHIDDKIRALAGGTSQAIGLGIGGMATKVEAAYLATQGGTTTEIAASWIPNVLVEIAKGNHLGTFFKPLTTSRESRKRWLLSNKCEGVLIIDKGAENKLCQEGASLLSVGIKQTKQLFQRGAVVKIASENGAPIAVGVSSYSSEEIDLLLGAKSFQIEKILGYSYGPEIIHRDNMTLLHSNKNRKE